MDLRLDPATGDLDLSTGTIEVVDGVEATGQKITIRLQFFRGEWFLDERIGIRYFQEVLGQKLRKNLVERIFRETVLTTPGVLSIENFELSFDGPTRALSISFLAMTVADDVPVAFDLTFIVGAA